MYVVTGDEMHQIDRYTMNVIGLNEEVLMESAGQAFYRQFISFVPKKNRVAVLIGSGNNGGDGFVIGRLLKDAGYDVDVWVIPPEERIRGTALTHKRIFEQVGFQWIPFEKNRDLFFNNIGMSYTVIVDALLGTGLKGKARAPYNELIDCINESIAKVIAVDIPSGLPSTEGEEGFLSVKADETYTFQAPLLTAYIYPFAAYYGKVRVLDIGIPKAVFEKIGVKRHVITEEQVIHSLPTRDVNAHKGSVGKALVIGGSYTMTGAPVLTTNACLRSGAGLVTLAVPSSIYPIVSSKITEATFLPAEDCDGELSTVNLLKELPLEQFDGIAIGPGLGRRKSSQEIFTCFKDFKGPLVIDADGLFHLSRELDKWKNGRRDGATIITPHLGEMARLTGLSVKEIERNRFEIVENFAKEHQLYVVLKGPYTILTTPTGEQWINTSGNPSLAKGGSGDVLTGIILAFLLQHPNETEAIINAVHIHGKTADDLIKTKDVISVTATDIVERLPKVIHSYR